MYSAPVIAFKYLRYFFQASNGRGHGIHSPFVYEFIREVLIDKKNYPAYNIAENYRQRLLNDQSLLKVVDLGAGSVMNKDAGSFPKKNKSSENDSRRKVSAIASTSVKPKRYSRLLYRIAEFYQYRNIIELGTSLGVTSTYLALVPTLDKLITMEGSEAIADYAETHFHEAGFEKVKLVRGNFDDTLGEVLKDMNMPDMIFIDGNHRRLPTLNYFNIIVTNIDEDACIIFDDIHWSEEMEAAWAVIKKDPRVKLSIDLFFVGIVFFRKSFHEKQDFTIRF